MIVFKDVTTCLGGKLILDNINLSIDKGETVAVIGLSGTGKSTLLRHIIGLQKPNKGQIFVNGVDITKIKQKELNEIRKKVGMVFQYSALFDSLTCGENVAFGLRQHTKLKNKQIKEVVKEKLMMVGLEKVDDLMPSQLSGGMQKRVGIARAIARDPEIILYDEPTTGLDPIMSSVINNLIKEMSLNLTATSVVVTHDVEHMFTFASKVLMLHLGKIIESGTVQEFKNSKNPIVQQFITGSVEGPIELEHLIHRHK